MTISLVCMVEYSRYLHARLDQPLQKLALDDELDEQFRSHWSRQQFFNYHVRNLLTPGSWRLLLNIFIDVFLELHWTAGASTWHKVCCLLYYCVHNLVGTLQCGVVHWCSGWIMDVNDRVRFAMAGLLWNFPASQLRFDQWIFGTCYVFTRTSISLCSLSSPPLLSGLPLCALSLFSSSTCEPVPYHSSPSCPRPFALWPWSLTKTLLVGREHANCL